MEKATESKLSFLNFRISKSKFEVDNTYGKKLNIEMNASGELNKAEKQFHLLLQVKVKDDKGGLSIEIDAHADYKLDGDLDDPKFNNYMYLNAPAILFPHIRAYIVSLTALSGISPVTLPLVNISGMKDILMKQTELL